MSSTNAPVLKPPIWSLQTPSVRWLLSGTLLSLAMLQLRPSPPPPDTSPLSQLPPELLLRITTYLPPTSAASFALCTKRLHALLCIPYLRCKNGHAPFSKAEFLNLLERDLPDHIVCYYCEKLHAIKRAGRHVKFTKRCDSKVNEAMRTYIHPRFSYVVFQMLMKRYRQDPSRDLSSLLNLLSYNEWSWIGPDETKTTARIVDGSLLLRQQHTRLVHPNNDMCFTHDNIMICPHIAHLRCKIDCKAGGGERYSMYYTGDRVDIDRTPTSVECECCSQRGKTDEGNWSGLIRCRDCATEFRIDTLGVGKAGKAFVVTRWKDLGEGREGEDPVWRAHVERNGGGVGVGSRAGGSTICKRFEGEGWRGGLESLVTPREMKRLVRYRYCFCEV